jgi:DNA-binding response OmpR family regulator
MTPNVLIIDDSLTVRMDLADAFEDGGFAPLLCATTADARETISRSHVDVIVLDVVLPDGDGVDLLREIRASTVGAEAVILMLSSEAEVRDRVRAMQTGADEYVGKPYDRGYVVAKARELLRRRSGNTHTTATVLIIDDSLTFREQLKAAVEKAGYHTLQAVSGEEGLRIAAAQRPNVIVVDGVLPGIDGAAVIRHIRLDAALRDTPCLLLTAAHEVEAELRALDAGADAFVHKGTDLDVIVARLGATLRAATSTTEKGTESSLGARKILAVDDSQTYLQELAGTLRNEGYDVALARSGEEALELLAVQSVDCVLLDLVMPGLGGHETCRRIKAAPTVRDTPLIMLTAVEDRSAMLEGLAAGADDYISKSSEFAVLKARVRAQIRRKQFEDENRRIREQLLRKEFEAAEERNARALAEARAALTEELERQNRELEAFSYTVSHDLRAPLRTIDGFSRALAEDFGESLGDQAKDYLRRVQGAAKRMGELIEDLLQLARVSRAELRRQRVDLSSIAYTIAGGLRDAARTVDVQIAPGMTSDADPGLVRTLLENLILNAWKFTSRTQAARIEVGTIDSAAGRAFFVRDNGVGFDQAHADRLFQPFQRLHSHSDFEGTGIGLATVQKIVNRHGGKVWAEGAPGQGATIYFTFGTRDA